MVLEGRIFWENRILAIKTVSIDEGDEGFSRVLEAALIELCRQMDIPAPIWLSKNTKEFAAFHQTIFFADQYTDAVKFDKFQIKMLS